MSNENRFPPITQLATVSLAGVVVGGILMASYAPRRPPLLVPTLLLGLSVVLLIVAVVMLARLNDFAWTTFMKVARWAQLAYIVVAGMIEFSFVRNHTRGAPLLLVTAMLVVFALDVPLIIATTVARYATPGPKAAPAG
ncbi:unannotated protein [freshwater metagenome]|uniref:Unannotated protein n=1 Tax=freshwater metagenome TaxID=449393 RepID=A0A6J7EHN0_9ZZZZ|nr:hypothetical protein [Actinomycetota bacterium]